MKILPDSEANHSTYLERINEDIHGFTSTEYTLNAALIGKRMMTLLTVLGFDLPNLFHSVETRVKDRNRLSHYSIS